METVWDAFADQARRIPGATAICGAADYTYAELAERALELSRAIAREARPGTVVALDATGPVAGTVAFLALARAGCSALPLDAESPPMRRAAILAEAGVDVLLREGEAGALTLEEAERGKAGDPAGPGSRWPLGAGESAYVMYTSGSTGQPKGVVVSHDAFLVRLRGLARAPGLGPEDSFLAMTALSFDPCLAELLLPLTVGARVVAAPVTARLDPAVFAEVVSAYRPSVMQATPSFWRLALAWGWKGLPGCSLWCGGEPLTPALADQLLRTDAMLWNVYGPTEGTIWSSAAQITSPEAIGLGSPLAGTGWFLEDEAGRLVTSAGEPGEILLYGDCLAFGYLNQPRQTAERFRVRDTPEGPRLCYRTGDRARYRDDGELEFLGRDDAQVKLRGHRVELGELEAVFEEHPAVREAAAVLRSAEEPERAHIAVFLASDGDVTVRQLRTWLAERLPASMRPSHISLRPTLPRTPTGKIDRVRLERDR